MHLWYSTQSTIRGNTVTGHRDGLYLEFSTDSLIADNVATDNIRYGLHFMYCHRNRYLRNTFRANQTGVAVMYSRVFSENDFIDNFFSVATNARTSENQFAENYWSNYRGYDLNHDEKTNTRC